MGLFDHVVVKYALPDEEVQNETFQTKDGPFLPSMDTYRIDSAGKLLWMSDYDEAWRPMVDLKYHGDLTIHAVKNNMFYEYTLIFTKGKITSIKRKTPYELQPLPPGSVQF